MHNYVCVRAHACMCVIIRNLIYYRKNSILNKDNIRPTTHIAKRMFYGIYIIIIIINQLLSNL